MTSPRPNVKIRNRIKCALQAAHEAGLCVGGVEIMDNGTIRILTVDSIKADNDPFSELDEALNAV